MLRLKPRRKPRLRKVYLLPNLFTAFNLFLGIYAILNVLEGDYERACWSIFLAGLLDGLDGAVARLTHTQSAFGLQFDSLSDLVSFGVAPAAIMYSLMQGLPEISHRLAVGVCSLYAICGALRLARYNVQAHGEERKAFTGLPIPGAAAVMVFTVLVWLEYQGNIHSTELVLWRGTDVGLSSVLAVLLPFLVLVDALLMVSEVPYPSILRKIKLQRRMSFDSLVSLILVGIMLLALKSDQRVILLFIMSLIYVCIGLGNYVYHHTFVRRQEATPAPAGPAGQAPHDPAAPRR